MLALGVGLVFCLVRLSAVQAELERLNAVLSRTVTSVEAAQEAAGSTKTGDAQPPSALLLGSTADARLSPAQASALTQLVRDAVRAEREQQGQEAAAAAAEAIDAAKVLEIVKRDQGATFERHLDFHVSRWADAREQSLAEFSERAALSPSQRARLDVLSNHEIEVMVELFKTPAFREHPEALAERWASTLETTDDEVEQLLDDDQMAAWRKGRALERKLLFPWLD